jgi:nucleoid DNA-binding protein
MKLYRHHLLKSLSEQHKRPQSHYARALSEILDMITQQLAAGHSVTLICFGTFYSRLQPAAKIQDIRTHQWRTIPAHRVAAFRVGDVLRKAVRAKVNQRGRPKKLR